MSRDSVELGISSAITKLKHFYKHALNSTQFYILLIRAFQNWLSYRVEEGMKE